MAASGSGYKKVLCSYFINGACRYGSDCRFSHDRTSSPSTVCRFYQAGRCSYGTGCRYDHVKAEKPRNVASASPPIVHHGASSHSASAGATKAPERSRKLTPLRKGMDYAAAQSVATCADEAVGAATDPSSTSQPQFHGRQDHDAAWTRPFVTSYADAATAGAVGTPHDYAEQSTLCNSLGKYPELCELAETGNCPKGEECEFIHGLVCSMCNLAVLHPDDANQREAHHEACLNFHELAMERAFAAQRSADKQCGICMETIVEKSGDKRFGILCGCSHVYCLACIRSWRAAQDAKLDVEAIRSCPECRVLSHYVIPSEYWIDTPEEKEKLIEAYKGSLRKRHCCHFARGQGQCPFGSSCFYLHAYPDGSLAPVVYDPPRRRYNSEGELEREPRFTLWDFLYEAATADPVYNPPPPDDDPFWPLADEPRQQQQ